MARRTLIQKQRARSRARVEQRGERALGLVGQGLFGEPGGESTFQQFLAQNPQLVRRAGRRVAGYVPPEGVPGGRTAGAGSLQNYLLESMPLLKRGYLGALGHEVQRYPGQEPGGPQRVVDVGAPFVAQARGPNAPGPAIPLSAMQPAGPTIPLSAMQPVVPPGLPPGAPNPYWVSGAPGGPPGPGGVGPQVDLGQAQKPAQRPRGRLARTQPTIPPGAMQTQSQVDGRMPGAPGVQGPRLNQLPGLPGAPGGPPTQFLPLTPEFEAGRRALTDPYSAAMSQLGIQAGQLAPEMQLALARMQTQQQLSQEAIAADFANRGIYWGGQYPLAVSRMGAEYDRLRQDLAFQMAQALSGIYGGMGEAGLGYGQGLAELLLQRALQVAQQMPLEAPRQYATPPRRTPSGTKPPRRKPPRRKPPRRKPPEKDNK